MQPKVRRFAILKGTGFSHDSIMGSSPTEPFTDEIPLERLKVAFDLHFWLLILLHGDLVPRELHSYSLNLTGAAQKETFIQSGGVCRGARGAQRSTSELYFDLGKFGRKIFIERHGALPLLQIFLRLKPGPRDSASQLFSRPKSVSSGFARG